MKATTIRFYEVELDVDRFQFLLPDEHEAVTSLFQGLPLEGAWVPPAVVSLKPLRPEADFWDFGLGGYGSTWVVRPEAFERAPELQHYLRPAGELLPLSYAGRQFVLLNVTEVVDALDRDRTEWDYYDDGSVADVDQPAFRADRLGEGIFKIPETVLTRIYCWEDDVNADDQFRGYVESRGLTGLTFTLVDTVASAP